jgi:acyl-CoA thioester hydrolase
MHQQFRHQHSIRVRSFHVDRQNVVHNLQYLFFFEEARVEYIRSIGIAVDEGTFLTHDKFFVVSNTCEYAAPAYFDEKLDILTRISYIGDSSIGFEHLAVKSDGTLCARGSHVFVHVDSETNAPTRVPERIRALVQAYEGEQVGNGKPE